MPEAGPAGIPLLCFGSAAAPPLADLVGSGKSAFAVIYCDGLCHRDREP
jgi:hypothetical protein